MTRRPTPTTRALLTALALIITPAATAQDAPKPPEPAAGESDQDKGEDGETTDKPADDPEIQGRKLSVWRAELQHDEPGRRRLAIAAIASAGPKARAAAADVAGRIAGEPEAALRVELVKTLRELKPAAPTVLEELKGALQDAHRGVRAEAIEALIDLGPAARPARADLMARLVLEDLQLCERIGHALSSFKDKALGAAIAGLLKDPRPPIRARAAVAAGCLGSVAAPALPALLDGLSDPDPEVAQTMNDALARLSLAPKDLPGLTALFKREQEREAGETRRTRLATLAYVTSRVRPGGALQLMTLMPLASPEPGSARADLRAGALRALRYSDERAALPAIFDALERRDGLARLDQDAALREALRTMSAGAGDALLWLHAVPNQAAPALARLKAEGLDREAVGVVGPALVAALGGPKSDDARAVLMRSKAAVHAWLQAPDAPRGPAFDELRAAVKPKKADKPDAENPKDAGGAGDDDSPGGDE